MSSFACRTSKLLFVAGILFFSVAVQAQESRVTLERDGSTIVLEPYAPNILRVTLSLARKSALAAPGYGFVATPANSGWSAGQTEKADVYQSGRMIATVDKNLPSSHPPLQTEKDIAKFFSGSAPDAHITLRTPEGKTLLELTGW